MIDKGNIKNKEYKNIFRIIFTGQKAIKYLNGLILSNRKVEIIENNSRNYQNTLQLNLHKSDGTYSRIVSFYRAELMYYDNEGRNSCKISFFKKQAQYSIWSKDIPFEIIKGVKREIELDKILK